MVRQDLVTIEMLFALIPLCFLLINVEALSRCPTYTAKEEWYSTFNRFLNPQLKWDPGLSSDACNEARGVVASNAPHKFTAERTFARGGSVPVMIGLTLINGLGDETAQTDGCTQPSCTHQVWMQQLLQREPSKSRLCLQGMILLLQVRSWKAT
ncbi:hypothetical protein COOONC_07528 [Cooperia oncophora]